MKTVQVNENTKHVLLSGDPKEQYLFAVVHTDDNTITLNQKNMMGNIDTVYISKDELKALVEAL